MTGRDFHLERLMERALELKAKHQGDHATYLVELSKLMMTNARNDSERRTWEQMLKGMKTARRFSLFGPNEDDKREEVVEQVRATLKARHPFIRFYVMRGGPRTSRRWEMFACKDLKFEYYRKSDPEPPRRSAPTEQPVEALRHPDRSRP